MPLVALLVMKILEAEWYILDECMTSLSECMCRMWTSCMHTTVVRMLLNLESQNIISHMHNTGTVSQASLIFFFFAYEVHFLGACAIGSPHCCSQKRFESSDGNRELGNKEKQHQ